jgi:hypothetical protein
MMHQFGRNIAKIHGSSCTNSGNYPETTTFPTQQFAKRFSRTINLLVTRFWKDDSEIAESLGKFIQSICQMPSPERISLIMPDMNPSQFLTDDNRITALVDIESYVRGPVELELAAIELWMVNADAFLDGYLEVAGSIPNIAPVRRIYRFFLYLLYRAPPNGLSNWLEAPVLF